MKLVTSTHKVWVILMALLGMAALGAGPALPQQAVKLAPMTPMQVKPIKRVVPDVLGKTLAEAQKILKKAGFNKVEIKGARTKDTRVQAQKPKGGEKVPLNARVILKTTSGKTGPATTGPGATKDSKSEKMTTSGTPGIGTSPIAPGGDREAPPKPDLPVFQADKPIVVYAPKAMLVIDHVRFTSPREDYAMPRIVVGQPIRIYVVIVNNGPAESTSSDFRVYLSRAGKLLQKVRSHAQLYGLQGNRATYADFHFTLPNKPGWYCWEVSLKQTLDGRMTLGDPKNLCAEVKPGFMR